LWQPDSCWPITSGDKAGSLLFPLSCKPQIGKVRGRANMASRNPETEQAIKEHSADAALRKLVTAGCEEKWLIGAISLMRNCDDSWEGLIGQAWPEFRGDLRRKLKRRVL
jgi:hypothetical protein